jgi:UDP-N-acetylmuramoyl-L-alanyl-D-glutamate--2,6-diaminopimelate ligase
MTTPDPPLLYNSIKQMVEYGCEYIVMEVSSHALALSKLEPLKFDVAIFTNISPEHLDFHGDMNSYFAAKYSLLKKSKCVIINIDDEYGRKAQNEYEGKKITVGVLWRADVWASNVDDHGFDGISYTYHGDGFSFKMRMPIPGKYNVYNSMLAAAACIELGCKPCEVKEKLATFSGVEGRYEIINDKIMVIIDYAHTYFAFESFLASLSANKNGRRLTVVFGCGGNRDKAKRPLMAKVAEKYADRIILTADNSRKESTKDIISDIIRGFEKGSYEIKEDRTDAIRTAILESKDGEIVALIGKGPEKYNIDSLGYHYFSEKDIIFSALDERAKRCGQCE